MFVDTPGIFTPKRRLETAMVKAASAGIADADLALLVLDVQARASTPMRGLALRQLVRERRRAFLVINKIDTVAAEKHLAADRRGQPAHTFAATFIVSALDGNGCDDLLAAVRSELPEGPWLFPEDQLSDLSDRALAAEITPRADLPPAAPGAALQHHGRDRGLGGGARRQEVRIDQTIYVLRDSQKPILIGKKGQQLKTMGEAARLELERILDKRVHLFLFVKVRENWLDDPERYREMGLDFGR